MNPYESGIKAVQWFFGALLALALTHLFRDQSQLAGFKPNIWPAFLLCATLSVRFLLGSANHMWCEYIARPTDQIGARLLKDLAFLALFGFAMLNATDSEDPTELIHRLSTVLWLGVCWHLVDKFLSAVCTGLFGSLDRNTRRSRTPFGLATLAFFGFETIQSWIGDIIDRIKERAPEARPTRPKPTWSFWFPINLAQALLTWRAHVALNEGPKNLGFLGCTLSLTVASILWGLLFIYVFFLVLDLALQFYVLKDRAEDRRNVEIRDLDTRFSRMFGGLDCPLRANGADPATRSLPSQGPELPPPASRSPDPRRAVQDNTDSAD